MRTLHFTGSCPSCAPSSSRDTIFLLCVNQYRLPVTPSLLAVPLSLLAVSQGDPVGLGPSVRCSRADPMVGTGIVVAAFLRIGSTASTITVSPSDSRGLLIWHDFGRGEHCVSSLVPPPTDSGPLPFSGNSAFRAMEFFAQLFGLCHFLFLVRRRRATRDRILITLPCFCS